MEVSAIKILVLLGTLALAGSGFARDRNAEVPKDCECVTCFFANGACMRARGEDDRRDPKTKDGGKKGGGKGGGSRPQ